MKVHSTLGNGFQEVIYQRAMEIGFPYHNLAFEREKEMSIFYLGQENTHGFRSLFSTMVS